MRDIYVQGVDIEQWQAALQAVLGANLRITFSVDGTSVPLPIEVAEVFKRRLAATVLLSVFIENVQLNCHFFDEAEIEFDLDPREVVGQASLDAVLNFMRLLAKTTNKPAIMTPENTDDAPFIRVLPSGATEYISSGGFFEDLARRR